MSDWHDRGSTAGEHASGTVTEFASARSSSHNGQPGSVPGAPQAAGTDAPALAPDRGAALVSGTAAARKLAQILEVVREMPGGDAVHGEAVRALADLERSCARAETRYSELLDLLLQEQAQRRTRGTDEHIQIELLRRRLQPPLLDSEDFESRRRLEALLQLAAANRAPAAATVGTASEAAPTTGWTAVDAANQRPEHAVAEPVSGHPPQTGAGDRREPGATTEARHANMDRLQDSLGREIRETLSQNEEFGVALDLLLADLQQVREVGDAQRLRQRLLDQVKLLHSGHFSLARKLDSADRYLRMLTVDASQLNDEIHRVRQLSLTDELTSLPNRRAFMTRLEEEVARVERYGMPLSIALIDLDCFKRINDLHGHAAGDEVLRCYATQIFSVFRNHDLVARYGGEEFAVLLPNTDRNGAAAALRKARECAARLRCRAADTAFPVPSFSAGVATFARGESTQHLIDRADEALYCAKRGGRDRVEFAELAKSRPEMPDSASLTAK